jgi:siroheme decarboxylase
MSLEATDRRLIQATQAGLPLSVEPYHALASQLGLTPEEVMQRLSRMQATGIIRRIAAVPNHYALGYTANGMSVWDVDDEQIGWLGPRVGALPFVTHCYRRPRRLPAWRYNLFAMIHARRRDEVAERIADIAEMLGDAARAHDVLYSTRILKKTGLRIQG